MTPIVSPSLIYLIGVLDTFNTIVFLIEIITGVLAFAGLLIMLIYTAENASLVGKLGDDEEYRVLRKYVRKLFAILALALFIDLAAPSKTTVIQMMVAKNITYERVDKIIKAGKNVKEELKKDVIDIIREIKKNECNSGIRDEK